MNLKWLHTYFNKKCFFNTKFKCKNKKTEKQIYF